MHDRTALQQERYRNEEVAIRHRERLMWDAIASSLELTGKEETLAHANVLEPQPRGRAGAVG